MLALQIIVCLIVAIQIFIAAYFPKLYGKVVNGVESKAKYEKYGGEWADNKCGGIWGEKGSKTYSKYYKMGVYNGVALNLMIFAVLGVFLT